MSVGELGASMSVAEFQEWMAFDEIDPFGSWRADLRMGILASTVAMTSGAKLKPSDFIPRFDRESAPVVGNNLLIAKFELLQHRGFNVKVT